MEGQGVQVPAVAGPTLTMLQGIEMGVMHSDRPEPSTRFIERFCLLSYHGTVLCADRSNGLFLTRRIGQVSAAQDVHIVATDVEGQSLLSIPGAEELPAGPAGDFAIEVQSISPSARSLISLRRADFYVTVNNEGTIRNDARHCREWEVFMLVRAGEIAALDGFLSAYGYFTAGDDTPRDLRRCGMGSNYVLHLAERKVDLAVVADLIVVLRGISHIDPPDGESSASLRHPCRARPVNPLRIHVTHLGMMANRALQYLVADNLRSRVDGAVISGVDVPEWSVLSPRSTSPGSVSVNIGFNKVDLDLPGLADCLARNVVDTVHIRGYPFEVQLYPPLERCRTLLPYMLTEREAPGFGPNDLVCNVRAGDILHGIHAGYLVLPPRYYRSLQERSSLDLVFFGQLDDSPYSNLLRSHFPKARFVQGRSPQHDFDVLRRSRNVAIGVSTFSWLAAWLGEAESIYFPVAGIFNPAQAPVEFHIPIGDSRYRYTLFPYAKMVNIYDDSSAFTALLELLSDFMKPISIFEMEQICLRTSRFRRPRPALKGFDNGHYLIAYPEVASAFYEGRLNSPLQHYLDAGYLHVLSPRAFDERAYLKLRPEAALAIAEGRFASPLHHAMS